MGEGDILCAPYAGVATGGAIRSSSRSILGRASPWVTRVKKHRRELSAFFRIPKWTRNANGEYFFSEFGSLPVLWSGSLPVRALLGRTFCTVRLIGARVGGSLSPLWSSLRRARLQWQIAVSFSTCGSPKAMPAGCRRLA